MKEGKKKLNTVNSGALKVADFVHLHNHTQYSLLDGLTKIGELVTFVKEAGMESIAITDHGTLSGWVEFYKMCKSNGVKPLLGIETYMAARTLRDKDPAHDRPRYHLILIAMNEVGVRNIMRLSTVANLEGYYYYPRIDRDLLKQYSEGIIVLSGCMGSEVGQALKDNRLNDARAIALWYKEVFGDRYYFEIQDHGHPDNPLHSTEQFAINQSVIALSRELDIQCVVTSDAHYLRHEDQEAHEVLLCVGTGSYLSDTNRMSLKEYPLHVESPKAIIDRWGSEYPDFIRNTSKIAERVNFDFELGKILIPKFPVPKGEDEKTYLHKLVWKGVAWRYGGIERDNSHSVEEIKSLLPKEIVDRTEYELTVIDGMGFNGYFLIIWDFINWGKNQGIVFGPGRGSAAGAIVAYALRITELDPIRYGLLFERFLNPDRISMPDIDIDISDDRRDEVIEYCRDKYGEDRVANIVTFGKMAARNAVRDTARVLQVPYAEADRLAKMIPPPVQGRHIPLATCLTEVAELKSEYENNPTSRQVFDMAMKLEGTIRSHGVHAAGVVIAPDDIVTFTPLERAQKQVVLSDGTKKDVVSTQFSMGPIEELGLLKMDFLGLANLTVIKNCLRIVKKVYKEELDVGSLPLDDPLTYELLQRGDTTGVFQLESSGMKKYLKELKPTVFDDISAMCALYRPGPLKAGLADAFIRRKNGLEEVTVPHPSFENALSTTYGTLVYQEQVMQISKEVCGFTGGEADTLRKAIGKKIREVMEKMQGKFIQGGVEYSGVPAEVMEKFWDDLMGFADYAFNKSHSACYGLIAYQTAYLKAHYPSAFMAALMTSDFDDTDRLAIEMNECRHMGISVLPPDVNASFHEFSVANEPQNTKADIRFGLDAIKNVGKGAAEEIIRAREDGPFVSLNDFISRVSPRVVNRKTWESLIKTGAFDTFGDRSSLLASLDLLLAMATKLQKERLSAQVDLFGNIENQTSALPPIQLVAPTGPVNSREYLQWERELLGLYLSSHPLDDYDAILSEQTIPSHQISSKLDNQTVVVGGVIQDVKTFVTKNGQTMAFVRLEDRTGELELVVFPSVYKDNMAQLVKDSVIKSVGRVSAKDKNGGVLSEPKILPDSIEVLSIEQAQKYKKTGARVQPLQNVSRKNLKAFKMDNNQAPTKTTLFIRIENESHQDVLMSIKSILDTNPGPSEVVLVLGGGSKKQALKLPFKVLIDEVLSRNLADVVGASNVVVR